MLSLSHQLLFLPRLIFSSQQLLQLKTSFGQGITLFSTIVRSRYQIGNRLYTCFHRNSHHISRIDKSLFPKVLWTICPQMHLLSFAWNTFLVLINCFQSRYNPPFKLLSGWLKLLYSSSTWRFSFFLIFGQSFKIERLLILLV